jgi:hypothetical protein
LVPALLINKLEGFKSLCIILLSWQWFKPLKS